MADEVAALDAAAWSVFDEMLDRSVVLLRPDRAHQHLKQMPEQRAPW
jgi:hypothetical protein